MCAVRKDGTHFCGCMRIFSTIATHLVTDGGSAYSPYNRILKVKPTEVPKLAATVGNISYIHKNHPFLQHSTSKNGLSVQM